MSGRAHLCIYSSNIYFIQGVKSLVSEVFSKRHYAMHVFNEKFIFNITSVKDIQDRVFAFTDTENPFLLLYLSLLYRNKLISGNSKIEDVLLFLRGAETEKRFCSASCLPGYLSLREWEMAICMKLRMTDDEIASSFELSKKTVSAHRRNIRLKLGIRNRNEFYKYLGG